MLPIPPCPLCKQLVKAGKLRHLGTLAASSAQRNEAASCITPTRKSTSLRHFHTSAICGVCVHRIDCEVAAARMPTLLQVDFPFEGPFGEEMAAGMKELAESIAKEPGFIWKVWTENAESKEAGGIYLFQDRASAEAYITMHTARLKSFGVPHVNCKVFDVNETLSAIDNAKLQ